MGWNGAYPAAYPPIYQNPYQVQNPYLQPTQMSVASQQTQVLPGTQMSSAAQPPQGLTLPTRYAEIIQVEDEGVVDRFQVGAGQAQMFMNKAETFLLLRPPIRTGPATPWNTLTNVLPRRRCPSSTRGSTCARMSWKAAWKPFSRLRPHNPRRMLRNARR